MSLIHIARNSTILGQFAEDAVRDGLANGTFLLSDLAWKDGMAEWQSLSRWPEFAAGAAALAGAAPIPAGTIPLGPPVPEWERTPEIGYWPAFWQTVKGILFSPSATFSAFPKSHSFLKSYIFVIIGGIVVWLLSMLAARLIGDPIGNLTRELMIRLVELTNDPALLEEFKKNLSSTDSTSSFFSSIIFLLIFPFLHSGILHLFLMLFAGAEKKFDATFRVTAYNTGALAFISWIPGIGQMIASLYAIILNTIGLSKVHNISIGKAFLVTIAPAVICCLSFATCGTFLIPFFLGA